MTTDRSDNDRSTIYSEEYSTQIRLDAANGHSLNWPPDFSPNKECVSSFSVTEDQIKSQKNSN